MLLSSNSDIRIIQKKRIKPVYDRIFLISPNIISKINGNIDLNNYKILSRDEKFMDLLKRTIKSFVDDYCRFVELPIKDVGVERLDVDEERIRISDDLLRALSHGEQAEILKKLQNKPGS